jgi:hypothetical protein
MRCKDAERARTHTSENDELPEVTEERYRFHMLAKRTPIIIFKAYGGASDWRPAQPILATRVGSKS